MLNRLKEYITAIVPMPDEEYQLLADAVTTRAVQKKGFLLRQGEVCKEIYFINQGFFRMYHVNAEGNEINHRFADQHNFMVDYQSFLTQKPSNYYWQALQDAEVLVIMYSTAQQLYRQSKNWERFGRLMAEAVYQQVNERIEMMELMTPEQRYQYLRSTRPQLFNQVSQFQLSSYLGIKPESLSRIRKRLLKS